MIPAYDWLEVLNPAAQLGKVRYALFDFDGTLSVIRRGWEKIMTGLMVECICEGQPPTSQIQAEITEYIDRSTGILTIKQMQWLADAVRRHNMAQRFRTASEYKRLYNERLLGPVRQRVASMDGSLAALDAWMIAGARHFLELLADCGIRLFLASGTDQVYVKEEVDVLDLGHFFSSDIYGALGDSETDSKEAVITRILHDYHLQGPELLVVGDGPVEITMARQVNAVALGLASDEDQRQGFNPRKRQRLLAADADLLVADFLHGDELVRLLCG